MSPAIGNPARKLRENECEHHRKRTRKREKTVAERKENGCFVTCGGDESGGGEREERGKEGGRSGEGRREEREEGEGRKEGEEKKRGNEKGTGT